MSDTRAAPTLEVARPAIERLLRATFEQLDALTPDVEIRRYLYAEMIARAVDKAEERLPGSQVVRETIAALFVTFHPQRSGAGISGMRERCVS